MNYSLANGNVMSSRIRVGIHSVTASELSSSFMDILQQRRALDLPLVDVHLPAVGGLEWSVSFKRKLRGRSRNASVFFCRKWFALECILKR